MAQATSKLRFSGFAVQWLRAYDFGLEEEPFTRAVDRLVQCGLVQRISHIALPDEVDEIDSRMFDVRYQARSQLVRVQFHPVDLVDFDLGAERKRTARFVVNLLLDLASGFGVFNLSLAQICGRGEDAYSLQEIGFLTRQWLLHRDNRGQPQRLNVRFYGSTRPVEQYIREIMNFHYLHTHTVLWRGTRSDYVPLLKDSDNFEDWLKLSQEIHPIGCPAIRELNRRGFTRSVFPTSFGPFIDVWGIEDFLPSHFDADTFSSKYEAEIAWLFTDGQRTTFGEHVRNLRNTKLLALYIWPNHALYINQHPEMIDIERVNTRVTKYGCLDIEVARILEIVNLQSALLHVFDNFLDQQLEQISKMAGSDQATLIQLTEQRRKMSHSTRSFDFYNLFHTAYWEPLYARLLEHPHLRLRDAANLVDDKLKRLDEEIEQATIVHDRMQDQQQQEQQLNILRGLHNLGMENDVQSRALLTINFLISATASLGITEVLAPWLTSLTGAQPSFPDAYPLLWIGTNVLVFLLVAWVLTRTSLIMIRQASWIIELEGRLDLPVNVSNLESYYIHHPDLVYFHQNINDLSGFVRIQKPLGVLVLEFNRERIFRYSVLLQRHQRIDLKQICNLYIEEETRFLSGTEAASSPTIRK